MGIDQRGLLARLVKELVRLPGVGQKSAQRLAFHLLKTERDEALRLADAIRAVKDGLAFCRQCRNIAEGELCEFCLDPKRDRSKILVVEEPSTIYAVERAAGYYTDHALFEFCGNRRPRLPIRITWLHLFFNEDDQAGIGKYAYEQIAVGAKSAYVVRGYCGVAWIEIEDGKISHWREYRM